MVKAVATRLATFVGIVLFVLFFFFFFLRGERERGEKQMNEITNKTTKQLFFASERCSLKNRKKQNKKQREEK